MEFVIYTGLLIHICGSRYRHGWGCQPDPGRAVKYLTAAASNSAAVEQLALQAGITKGGAAKGELVLAIFELANCFRNGWGVDRDDFAAKQVSFCLQAVVITLLILETYGLTLA